MATKSSLWDKITDHVSEYSKTYAAVAVAVAAVAGTWYGGTASKAVTACYKAAFGG